MACLCKRTGKFQTCNRTNELLPPKIYFECLLKTMSAFRCQVTSHISHFCFMKTTATTSSVLFVLQGTCMAIALLLTVNYDIGRTKHFEKCFFEKASFVFLDENFRVISTSQKAFVLCLFFFKDGTSSSCGNVEECFDKLCNFSNAISIAITPISANGNSGGPKKPESMGLIDAASVLQAFAIFFFVISFCRNDRDPVKLSPLMNGPEHTRIT
jgi:hypothetical protein